MTARCRRRSVRVGALLAWLPACAAPFACGGRLDASDDAPPERLSETGLYTGAASRELAPGLIAYSPSHPLWSDGSDKTRYLQLPPGTQVDTRDMDRWTFPVGTKAWKEFRVDGKLVETRLLWKRRPEPGIDSWFYAAYVWSPDGSDATVTVEGTPGALGTNHDVPSQEDCKVCHMHVRDGIIGFSAIQLSPSGLSPLAREGVFTDAPASDLAVPGSGVVRDALGYLHGNCGFCHNDRMNAVIKRTIRLEVLSTDRSPEETGAYTTTFHTKMFHSMEDGVDEAVVPGQPERSQLYRRMVRTDFARMPPKGTKLVDPTGSASVRDWILGLPR